jgi:D-serine deaminase-like pyridoxal phosphate-dependent protein
VSAKLFSTIVNATIGRSRGWSRRSSSSPLEDPDEVQPLKIHDLMTPVLLIDGARLEANLTTMAEALPGGRLRPHVKAHKSTSLAKRQRAAGHATFCCATIREIEGMARAGIGDDLLLANEVLDASRLGAVARTGARVTVAVDSEETLVAAHQGGVREVLIDVNVGLPRCGCRVEDAGRLAERARGLDLEVRGVMGYEGHVVGVADRRSREEGCAVSMEKLALAHHDVGGEVVSAGGTGTYDCNQIATEIQAGSYALMDTACWALGLPFVQALSVLASVISVSEKFAVANAGLKSIGMDHGNPTLPGARVLFCSDEHTTWMAGLGDADPVTMPIPEAWQTHGTPRVGDRIHMVPAHVDPTLAYHERVYVVDGEDVLEEWPIDLRGW